MPLSHRGRLTNLCIGAALYTANDKQNSLVLTGHAVSSYLTTSSLTEVEWEVLLPAVCARYLILLIIIRQTLVRDGDKVKYKILYEWNHKRALTRPVSFGKRNVIAIWKDICEGYSITF